MHALILVPPVISVRYMCVHCDQMNINFCEHVTLCALALKKIIYVAKQFSM